MSRADVGGRIERLADNLLNTTYTTAEFLLRLEDGRLIDAKGWAGWEWTHGIGLYGLLQYWQLTGSDHAMGIIRDWFDARLAEGTPTKNISTVAPS